MPRFSGFLYDDAGAAIASATVHIYDRNTTTPSRANTTTNAAGYYSINHATEGQFDVEITSGSSVRRLKYDDEVQLETLEANRILLRGTDHAFNVIFATTPTAERTLTLPDSSFELGALVGEQLTEGTTTSTTAVSLLTVSSISVPVTTPLYAICNIRKTTGAAAVARIGLMINATEVAEPITWAGATNEVASAVVIVQIGHQAANYLRAGSVRITGYAASGNIAQTAFFIDADMPNATITSLIIRASVGSSSITMGADDFRVYALAT